MAKKKLLAEPGSSTESILDLVKTIDDSAEIISDSAYSNIKEWIPSGNFMLNACMSGDLFKALPCGRVTTLFGPSGVGKSYLQISFCREAQKLGYTPIILDSEGALDAAFVKRLGLDPQKTIIKQVSTITECSKFIANLCKALEEQVEKTGTHDKVIITIDSLGNLTSEKEREDTLNGNQKRDMTKQQEIKALFRVNATPIARLGIPLIVVSHSYASIGSYVPMNVLSGGSGISYNSSITLELSIKKLEDKENDELAKKKVGVNTTKNGVLVTAKPTKSRFCIPNKVSFQIPFFKAPNPYVGLEQFLTWDNAGVVRGNCLTEKEFNKLSQSEQLKCKPFTYEGTQLYAMPKDTARGIVVKHLGRQVNFIDFFSQVVFNNHFLRMINQNIIKPLFQLPDQNSYADMEEIEDSLVLPDQEMKTEEQTTE